MLRTRLFRGFALVVILFAALSAALGIRAIKTHVKDEAQNRVCLNLHSAWGVCNSRRKEIETIVSLIASKEMVIEACDKGDWTGTELRDRLERLRVRFKLDYLGLSSVDGKIVLRTVPSSTRGDFRGADPLMRRALAGETVSGMALFSPAQLAAEDNSLVERAFMELENTPRSRMTSRTSETRGMVMTAASPVRRTDRVTGVVYGGMLVNRNHDLIDEIHDVVYRNEKYRGAPMGTATFFLHDCRIATTVRLANGNRALGTRVSKEVADRVLDNGVPWVGEAFVVHDWYLTAYDPIRTIDGDIIGMLYVGVLRRPFEDYGRALILRYVFLSVIVLLVALVLSYIMANRLARPIRRLVEAANRMSNGDAPAAVPEDNACRETERLIGAFNEMSARLVEREERLRATNRSYMETLTFVTHELKSPIATMVNYVYLLQMLKLGPLTEKQAKAVQALDRNVKLLMEMVRHYLNLSRVENGELTVVRTDVRVQKDVLQPLLLALHEDLSRRKMRIEDTVPADMALNADLTMVREIFENLLSNALKYGREGGLIALSATTDGALARFAVRNEGDGIPESRLGDLFKKFSRGPLTGSATAEKGTGLGLFITRHLVEAHGGTIEASSVPGAWTEFVFTLPIAAADRNSGMPESGETGRG